MKKILILSLLAMTLSTSVMAQHKSSRKSKVTNTTKSSSKQQKGFKEMMSAVDRATRKVKAASTKTEAYNIIQDLKSEINALNEKYPELSNSLTSAQLAEYNKRVNELSSAVMYKR